MHIYEGWKEKKSHLMLPLQSLAPLLHSTQARLYDGCSCTLLGLPLQRRPLHLQLPLCLLIRNTLCMLN